MTIVLAHLSTFENIIHCASAIFPVSLSFVVAMMDFDTLHYTLNTYFFLLKQKHISFFSFLFFHLVVHIFLYKNIIHCAPAVFTASLSFAAAMMDYDILHCAINYCLASQGFKVAKNWGVFSEDTSKLFVTEQ